MSNTTENLPVTPAPSADPDGLAGVLESLLLDSGMAPDRAVIRRVSHEAQVAFPGRESERWYRWIGEAGTNLGLKCKVVDCKPVELFELAQQGARLIFYVDDKDPWRAVTGVRGRRFRLTRGFDGVSQWGSTARLWHLIGPTDRHTVIRCVIVETAAACAEVSSGEPGTTMTPLARLLALLRPERRDIAVLVLFALVVGLLSLATPIAVDSLVSTVAFGRMVQPLVVLALLLFGFLGFSAGIRALKAYVVEIIQCRLFARVAADLSYRLPRVQTEYLDRQFLPDLTNRFFDVVTVQKVTASLLLDALQLAINALVGMALLAFYHPWLLGFDITLLAFMVFGIFILGRGAVQTSIKESKWKYYTAGWLEDLARCPVAFRLDGGAEFALERSDQLIYEYLTARKKHFQIVMRQILFSLGLQAVASGVILGIGGWLVMRGRMTLGQLVAAELIVTLIVGSLAKLGKSMESFYDLMASTDKLGSLFDLPVEDQEGILHEFPDRPASLIVHDVDYQFPAGNVGLKPVTFEVASGERIALAGSGKSVLLDLVFGLRSPTHGHVSVDGIDIRDLRPDFLRRRVALARGPEVFHGSVAENVHLARPDITAHAVRDALEQVGLLSDVSQFPEGIATVLTGNGAPLTETQIRRLMLARAIVGRPGLLLIDGVLDTFPDTEAMELLEVLSDSRQSWTLVLVTAREQFSDRCSRVIDLESDSDPAADLPPEEDE